MTYQTADIHAVYLALFTPRVDDHATYRDGWHRARAPLPVADLVAREPRSLYFLDDEGTGHVAAHDCDGSEGVANGVRLARELWAAGIPAYVELSRSGAHVWVSNDELLPARVLRWGLQAVRQRAGLADDKSVELRPSTDMAGTLGGCLRAPMTRSPKTGESAPLVDPRTMEPLHDKIAGMLLRFEQADADRWRELAATYQPPVLDMPTGRARSAGHDLIAEFNAKVTVTQVLEREYGVIGARPGRAIRCISPGHDDRHPSMSILPDDRRVFCHWPGCELHNGGRGRDAFDLWKLAQAVAA
jgi:hypothetical protein